MPTKKKLSWHKGSRSWRKKIDGKDYYFIPTEPRTQSNMEGYRLAYAAYVELLKKLDTEHPQAVKAKTSAELLQAKAKYLQLAGNITEANQAIAAAQSIIQQGASYTPTDDFQSSFFYSDNRQEWQNKIEAMETVTKADDGKLISVAIDDFLNSKLVAANGGKISAGRWDYLRRTLGNCLTFLGDGSVSNLNGLALTKVYGCIISEKDWSGDYQESNFIAWRQFIRWCWENEIIKDLPRNINSKGWTFNNGTSGKQPKPKLIFPTERIKIIMETAPDKIKLWVLLALNCGYTQKDLSSLMKSEVDWETGRITRKRSKTEKAVGTPVVSYKLWDVTFDLLKKLKAKRGDRVLTTRNGTPYVIESIKKDAKGLPTIERKDVLARTFYLYQKQTFGNQISFKSLRKTGNTTLGGSEYRDLRHHYLGHSEKSIADKHYDVESVEFRAIFDKAVDFIGRKLEIIK